MNKKRVTKIVESLNSLSKTDIYSIMLFTLYKLQDIPEYSTLSELCYILDNDNLTKFLSYYGGMTIKVPTLKELRLVLQTLLLYQYVNVEQGDFNEGLKVVSSKEFSADQITDLYTKLSDIIENYEFKRD